MILSPRKSVTRFFIPLIDVLILLFCMFLLLPFVSNPDAADPADPKDKDKTPDKMSDDVKTLQEQLKEARMLVARLEREKSTRVTDRLAVRVLEIDPTSGTLYYYDPGRQEVRTEADAVGLITRQKTLASQGGVVKDVFFLILPPRRASAFPTAAQIEQIGKWFKDVPYGFDSP